LDILCCELFANSVNVTIPFRAILDKAPDDRPSRYLLEHTVLMRTELGGTVPSKDWRGVHVHRSKM
jgi:hypothetical protein